VRILHVNKFLHRRGGAESYMADLAEIQEAAGHDVAFFGMEHPDNDPHAYAGHFPARVEFNPMPTTLGGRTRAVGRMLWSSSAARGIDAVVDAFGPDVVHLHNIYHQLSPSVLRPLDRRGIPAVMTLHDYKLACPTYRFLDHGQICEACLGGHFHQAVRRRCQDGSLLASTAAAASSYLHAATGAYRPVGRFLCPSRFMESKMRAAGVFPDRLEWVPHFVDCNAVATADKPGRGVVCAGRLSNEKGIDVLIEAVGHLGPSLGDAAHLDIVGEGPEQEALARLAEERAPGQVRFHGRVAKAAVHDLIRNSTVLALPSRWYENQPMIVLEALACGVPVVGTSLGGTPEIVADGVDGTIVAPDDPEALAGALGDLLAHPRRAFEMGRAGRAKVESDFTPQRHWTRVRDAYAGASTVTADSKPG